MTDPLDLNMYDAEGNRYAVRYQDGSIDERWNDRTQMR